MTHHAEIFLFSRFLIGRGPFYKGFLLFSCGTVRAELPVVVVLNVRNGDRDIPFWDDCGILTCEGVQRRGIVFVFWRGSNTLVPSEAPGARLGVPYHQPVS
jgi:hypothetical protein